MLTIIILILVPFGEQRVGSRKAVTRPKVKVSQVTKTLVKYWLGSCNALEIYWPLHVNLAMPISYKSKRIRLKAKPQPVSGFHFLKSLDKIVNQ
jgi:hypothetical protein